MSEPISPKVSERLTRKEIIDKRLEEAGWTPILGFQEFLRTRPAKAAVQEYETDEGPADYILFCEGVALAAVEVKKLCMGPQSVLTQAERYARGFRDGPFRFGEFRLPFAYSTTGLVIWFRDLRTPDSRSRKVSGFHTPTGLKEMLSRDRDSVS